MQTGSYRSGICHTLFFYPPHFLYFCAYGTGRRPLFTS